MVRRHFDGVINSFSCLVIIFWKSGLIAPYRKNLIILYLKGHLELAQQWLIAIWATLIGLNARKKI